VLGLDTNLLVRFVVRDSVESQAKVDRLITRELGPDRKGYVNLIVLAELIWVLGRSYRMDRMKIAQIVSGILDSQQLVVERTDLVIEALSLYQQSGLDFADLLINLVNRDDGCSATVTLDQGQSALKTARVL
jgi:predicted nucleic-acid-binding protein